MDNTYYKNIDSQKDSITTLLNYAHTREFVSEYLKQQDACGALLLVDIDNFQVLNETLGYFFGDQIIVSIAKILTKTFRKSDVIGRIGGDHFLILMKGELTDDLIEQKADEVCCEVQKIYCGEAGNRVSVSIGVVKLSEQEENFDGLCERAQQALYYAKSKGKNYCQFYEADMAATELKPTKGTSISKDSYDVFYNEIAEMTFRLLEDTTDADSSILLLLRKIKEYFGFAVVSVQEIVEDKPRTLKFVYNLVSEGIVDLQSDELQFEQEAWIRMKNMLERGRQFYELNMGNCQAKQFCPGGKAEDVITGLRLPIGKKEYFTGVANFLYIGEGHQWEEKEIRFLESFTRILSVYINRVRTFDEAEYLARMMRERDSVTGLFSYDTFLSRMKEFYASQKDACDVIYTYSDFSNFKYINETYGYDVGNLLLRKFGEFVLSGDDDEVICASRVHSDNIVTARKNTAGLTPQEFAAQIDACNAYMADMLKQYSHDNMISIRSGVFFTRTNHGTVEEAVTNAGYACKKNKTSGNNKCMIFSDALMDEYRKRLRYISELNYAMETGELQVYIQPKTLAKSNEVVGGEALIRWIKPNNQTIYPNDFIPVFEKSGDIIELDYFVYREVCKYLRRRMDAGLPVVPISVNVSTLHLRDDAIKEYLDALLEEYKIPAKYFELELTENVYIDDVSKALELLAWCKERGIRMAMDDFGSGYSSLNILDEVPIDVMKIDRSFLKNQSLTNNDKIILECVINMADKLDITTVCEGVENAEQLAFLCGAGCDVIQGYYIGKPMPMSAFDCFLEENSIKTE